MNAARDKWEANRAVTATEATSDISEPLDGAPSSVDDKDEVAETLMPAPTTSDIAVDSPQEDAPAIQE